MNRWIVCVVVTWMLLWMADAGMAAEKGTLLSGTNVTASIGSFSSPQWDNWNFSGTEGDRILIWGQRTGTYLRQLAATGLYSLVLRDVGTNTGGYNLSVDLAADVDPDPAWILPGQTLRDTQLHAADDVDYVVFYAEAGNRVRFTAAGTSGLFIPVLSLFPPADSNAMAQTT